MLNKYQYNIESLNNKTNDLLLFKREEEGKYLNQVKEIATNILRYKKRIILMAGPSASGKTTSSFLLQNELSKLGVSSHVMNMDEFFLDADTIPLVDGKPDIEGICALDVTTIKKCLGEILLNGRTKTPSFDFATHKRKRTWVDVSLHNNEVVLLEGIHALNPCIIEGLDVSRIHRIYVHCSVEYIKDNNLLLNGRDLRLIRRMIRDARDRQCSASETLSLWKNVCIGEEKNIAPFIEKADQFLNTAHAYEPMIYKSMINGFKDLDSLTLLKIKNKLHDFEPIDGAIVSPNSVIREFIGNN